MTHSDDELIKALIRDHEVSIAQAQRLIELVGRDREKLDVAASMFKRAERARTETD